MPQGTEVVHELMIPYLDYYRRYGVDPSKAAFVGEIARARTGFGRDYLVYGTMLRPLEVDAPPVELDYHVYNAPRNFGHYGERGRMRVPSIHTSAWRAPRGGLGFFFVSLEGGEGQPARVVFDPASYGLEGSYRASLVTGQGRRALGLFDGSQTFDLELAPRQVVLLEIEAANS